MKKIRHHACVASSSQESPPLKILRTFLALLILIWHLTHTFLRQFLTPHRVQSSIKPSFHLYPIFPMMSHCVFALLLISSDLSFDSSCSYHFCNMAVLSGMFSDSCADSLSDSCRNVA